MRAAVFSRQGPPDELRVVDHPAPAKPGHGELLLRVVAAGCNPVDFKQRSGELPGVLMMPRPWIVGLECSGVVEKVGEGAGDAFAVGDRVAVCVQPVLRTWGCCAELVLCRAEYCCLLWHGSVDEEEMEEEEKDGGVAGDEGDDDELRRRISLTAAAGVPLCGLTAWQSLECIKDLKRGDAILIHAGAGGVGSLCCQLAKSRGLHVTATCGPGNIDFLKDELRCDRVVDYTLEGEPFEQQLLRQGVSAFDAVIDVIGGDYEARSRQLLKRRGTYVSVINSGYVKVYNGSSYDGEGLYSLWRFRSEIARAASMASSFFLSFTGLGPKFAAVAVHPSGEQLQEIFSLIRKGHLRVFVSKVFALEDIREAHALLAQNHTRGKIILRVS